MVDLSPPMSITALNVSHLGVPNKTGIVKLGGKGTIPNYMLSTKKGFKYEDSDRLRMKGWRNMCSVHSNETKESLHINNFRQRRLQHRKDYQE